MTIQLSTAVRNARLDAIETAIGVSAVLKILSGAAPANCAAADTGTVLATLQLPADWMQNAAGGAKSKSGTWEDTAADAAGTAGYYRIYDAGGACHEQGTCGAQVAIPTTAASGAGSNQLTFASTNGVVVGTNVSGTGIPANTTVVSLTGTVVTLSSTETAGVASGSTITFAPDMTVDNAVFAAGQDFVVTVYSFTDGNA